MIQMCVRSRRRADARWSDPTRQLDTDAAIWSNGVARRPLSTVRSGCGFGTLQWGFAAMRRDWVVGGGWEERSTAAVAVQMHIVRGRCLGIASSGDETGNWLTEMWMVVSDGSIKGIRRRTRVICCREMSAG